MNKIIIIRYAEIHLKGRNRSFFENVLVNNIKGTLRGFEYKLTKTSGRYLLTDFDSSFASNILGKLKCVFGIHSLSEAEAVTSGIAEISAACCRLGVESGSFKVSCNRADKKFPLKSFEMAAEAGGVLLEKFPALKVDLFNPQKIVYIDIRECRETFVYSEVLMGAGGLPVGCGGKGMLLLSGGIDSPVAGYMMAKRGMNIVAVHFHSYPYTSAESKEKTLALAEKLKDFTAGKMTVFAVPFAEIQTQIRDLCPENYLITIMRRFMMRISQIIAAKNGAGALITGESLGQVASQTLESITVTNAVASIPVFRPLIGFDKSEIVKIAQHIDTFNISIIPHEDCCTVFLPANPVIKPRLERAEMYEKALNVDDLIQTAVENTEVIEI